MRLPHKFGRYVLTSKIAQGGMAEIYRAKYLGEGGFVKQVAVKRILPHWSDNRQFTTMLIDEAKALVHLQHQNIVQVYELGKEGDVFFISMEYVEGVDLRKLFKRIAGPPSPTPSPLEGEGKGRGVSELPLKFTCFIVCEILKALNFAHTRTGRDNRPLNIIHRDISPQNILISYSGEVKVADFGIAKGAHRSHETTAAHVKGKYAYMSPEQAEGRSVDVRTDLYATGVILYELLVRRRLYDAPNDLMTIEEVKRSVLPNGWEDFVPAGLRPIVRRSLQREPELRYRSAAEFLGELNDFVISGGIITNGIELSKFLKDMFSEDVERMPAEDDVRLEEIPEDVRPQTKVLSIVSRTKPEAPGRRARYVLYSAAFLAAAFITGFGRHTFQLIDGQYPVGGEPAENYNSQPAVQVKKNPPPPASHVNVAAIPWGYVYIPGYIEKRETPVKGVKLRPGSYAVKVNYEPEGKWAEQKITVAEGADINCLANFEGGASMTCRAVK